QVYIANVVKSRPPNNRTPTPAEAAECGQYLKRQIEIIAPAVVLTLGGPAAKFLLDTRDGVTRLRGNWHTYHEAASPVAVMPTFHPAYLLRSYTPENRRKVWEDLQQVMGRLGL
ncbi:MAG: uracil-DNA glycosylase, partial [Planctomycetota bacterium]